jgi:outer membrane protein assembly factor BamB
MTSLLSLVLLAAAHNDNARVPAALLDNWHHWRGPLACGVAPRGEPPLKWDEKTNIKWKAAIPGRGSSTPIVWGDRVFVTSAVDTGRPADEKDRPRPNPQFQKRTQPPATWHQHVVLCLDRSTGKELWKQVAAEFVPHEGHHPSHSYGAFSPTTDGKHLWCWFGSHGVYCYDLDGKKQWDKQLGRMETRLGWGEAGAPVLANGTLLVNFDHEGESFLVALEAGTGKERWRVGRDEASTWSTPLVVARNGGLQVVTNGTKRVRSYDLATGRLLWQCGGMTANPIPSPVADDKAVYCLSGYRGAMAFAVPLDAEGDLTDTDKLLWKHDKGTPYVPSPVLVGGRLYFTAALATQFTCLDAKTGRVLIDRERLPDVRSFYASPTAAAGRLYLVSREGVGLVLKQSDRLEVLAVNRLDAEVDASPVIVGKQLLLRGHKHLYCIEEK